jgi:AcrR family transcriptional regulator
MLRAERTKVRRVPTQDRSRKRVEAILDAAANVFADSGFEAATMEAIAAKAETSIGSMYQFFPNKLSVFEALGARWVERSRAAFEMFFVDGGDVPWRDMLDALVDGFALLHRTDPAFRAMLVNFQLYGLYAEADTALQQYVVEQVSKKLVVIAPDLTKTKR